MGYDRETGWTASFKGVVAAPLTPFGDEGELRLDRVPRMVEFLLERRVTGLLAGGTTGEFVALTIEERRDLLDALVRAVDGRARVIAHVGHVDRRKAQLLAEHARVVGADATTAIAPYYHGVSESACGEYFGTIAGATPELPFFVYNFPGATGNPVPFPVFESLLELPNVCGAKHSVGSFEEIEPYLSLPDHLCIMAGNDTLASRFLRSGGRAIVSGNAAAFPEVLSNLVEAVTSGRDDATEIDQIERIVMLGRSGAPDRLRQLLNARGVEMGTSRVTTFSSTEIGESHTALARQLMDQLAG
jgi:dihydrodipicolinate synthase/N-acetylneuraminate lyase